LLDNEKRLVSLLDELGKAVEELLMAGLTAASKSTIERLDVSFKEASRMKLLRLGSTLRIANEEISRFTTGSTQFSARRLVFFLGRAWLLASAMRRAINASDQEALNRLLVTPPAEPVERLTVVTLGVSKRVVRGAFASFDFRLRAIGDAGPIADREPLIWSCVFPLRKDLDLPTEAFLHLPQKQKFKPSILLEKKFIEVTKCAVSPQPGGAARLVLGEASTLTAGAEFDDWGSLFGWDMRQAAARLEQHRPTPMDLEIELQEEVYIPDWQAGESTNALTPCPSPGGRGDEEGYDLLPIHASHLPLEMRLDRGPSGVPVRGVMTKMAAKKKRPPIYGVVHYESCRLILQPLSVLGENGIEYLTVSPDKIKQAELVKAMKFT
jgi:hypothetical protein